MSPIKESPIPKRECPQCRKEVLASRGVCPECGHVTPWFRARLIIGCVSLSIAFIGILVMLYLAVTAPAV